MKQPGLEQKLEAVSATAHVAAHHLHHLAAHMLLGCHLPCFPGLCRLGLLAPAQTCRGQSLWRFQMRYSVQVKKSA